MDFKVILMASDASALSICCNWKSTRRDCMRPWQESGMELTANVIVSDEQLQMIPIIG